MSYAFCLTGPKSILYWVEVTCLSPMWQMMTVELTPVLLHIKMRILVLLRSLRSWVSEWLEMSLPCTLQNISPWCYKCLSLKCFLYLLLWNCQVPILHMCPCSMLISYTGVKCSFWILAHWLKSRYITA